MNENVEQKKKGLTVIQIILAWISVLVIGVILLVITTQSSTINKSQLQLGVNSDISIVTLNGLLGIILILLIINVTRALRTKVYFYHLRIGLFIGLGIYCLLFGIGMAINFFPTSIATNDSNVCLSAHQQFAEHAAAVVPISTELGSATGFAVNNDTTILTAYHVIEDAKNIKANYSSGPVNMSVIDTAPQYDLALLKIDKPVPSFFNLDKTYSTGDEVYAYGYPGNVLSAGGPSLSTGIVSRVLEIADLRMTIQDAPDGLELIQTDAAINPGNSGGPLISDCGVVGVASFISDTSQLHRYFGSVSEQNIGFAVSSRTVESAFPEYFSAK